MGARNWPMIFSVPGDKVYRPSSVRSMRGARRHWLLATTAATNTTTRTARPNVAKTERRQDARMSAGPPHVEHDHADGQPEHDAEHEVDHVAHIQHAARDGREMLQETHVGHRLHQRCPQESTRVLQP